MLDLVCLRKTCATRERLGQEEQDDLSQVEVDFGFSSSKQELEDTLGLPWEINFV